MFKIVAEDETWGENKVLGSAHEATFADAKAMICRTVDHNVKYLRQSARDMRITTTSEVPGQEYEVVIEWSPDGDLLPADWNGGMEGDWLPATIGLQCAVVLAAVWMPDDK